MISGRVDIRLDKLQYLRKSANNVAIRKSINKAGVPVKAALQAAVPAQFGNLKKSIRIKAKYYKNSSTWALIVGPSSSFARVRKKPKVQTVKKKPNKTLAKFKKKVQQLRQQALKKATKAVNNLAGRRQTLKSRLGRKLATALRNASKPAPKQKLPKPVKKLKRRRKWNGKKVRPAYYSAILQWGSVSLSARRFLERALSSSKGRFASILTSALKEEIKSLLSK